MKEKGDPCVMVGYSTQSKGYRVYNKRTRLIVESIHIKFDEIKEMMSDHNSSDLAPQRQEMSVENVSSGLVPQGQKASDYDNSDPVPPRQNVVPTAEKTDSSQQGLEFLFSPLLEEYYNPTHGLAEENNNDQAPNASFQEAEFINPFCTRVQEIGESSSRNIDNTDVHSFQPQSHDYRWTRDHPLEQVRGNPTMPVQTRRQLATDPEMCMFALTVSIVEPKNIKEAMADSAWIEAMQDELHQFDRLKVWELVDKPFGKMIIKLKWLWKNKKDEDQTELKNKLQEPGLRWNYQLPDVPRLFTKDVDLSGEPVDQSDYRSKIGSLMYLTSSRPDLVQAVCYCARYQARPTQKHLKETPDHAGCLILGKCTSGGIQFLWVKTCKLDVQENRNALQCCSEAEYVALSASVILFSIHNDEWKSFQCHPSNSTASSKSSQDDRSKPLIDDEKKVDEDPRKDSESFDQEKDDNVNSTNNVNAASTNEVNDVGGKISIEFLDDPNMPALEDYSIFDPSSDDQENGAEADINNLDTTI
ncbi:retrovirus-related pol polyprotein from transposon TNT 1-94 [Tanacetum coccineum]|uniref:Retrovirus-related pol polyprotein from transposon TNT 1-94 n=1 Tax=Tanacetum coccineum TaxID=301880 RepID=A0ABQ5CCH2_9ASTR